MNDEINQPSGLSREAVVAAALGLLGESGLDGLSMRALADRLGVKAASLYWHVRDKQQVLELRLDGVGLGVDGPLLLADGGAAGPQLVGLGLVARRHGGADLPGHTLDLAPETVPLARQLLAAGVELEDAVEIGEEARVTPARHRRFDTIGVGPQAGCIDHSERK